MLDFNFCKNANDFSSVAKPYSANGKKYMGLKL